MIYKDSGLPEAGNDVVSGLQKAFVSAEEEMPMESVLEKVVRLEERLNRVRNWGGAYNKVEFSPQVEAFLSLQVQSKMPVSA